MGRHSRAEDPAPSRPERPSGSGYHRAVGKTARRRRVAAWPIASAVVVALLVLGWLGWGWADNVLNSRAEAKAADCAQGNAAIKVLVTPSAEKPLTAAAGKWNQAKTVVRSHCVQVDVRATSSQLVLDALTGRTNLDSIGGLPAAWIPEASSWVGQLSSTRPDLVGATAESVASARSADYPYLCLAGKDVDEVQARAAQVFRDFLKQPAQQADFAAAGLTTG